VGQDTKKISCVVRNTLLAFMLVCFVSNLACTNLVRNTSIYMCARLPAFFGFLGKSEFGKV